MKTLFTLLLLVCLTTIIAQTGFHLEYKITNAPLDSNVQILHVYSKDGNSLNEYFKINEQTAWTKNIKLKKEKNTDYSYAGDTYIKMQDKQLENYNAELIGTEKINNYNCTKLSVQVYPNSDKTAVWITNEVKDYQNFLSTYVHVFNLTKLNKVLKSFKLTGFPVRIEYSGDHGQVYTFIKAEPVVLDDSLFEPDKSKQLKGQTSDELKRKGDITDEQYRFMKIEEEKAKKAFEEKKKGNQN